MKLHYQFALFTLYWPRALTLGKSQFDQKLNSIFFSNSTLTLLHFLKIFHVSI
jgi:hypothetical protein